MDAARLTDMLEHELAPLERNMRQSGRSPNLLVSALGISAVIAVLVLILRPLDLLTPALGDDDVLFQRF